MLREVHIAGFKCFESLDLPLRPLTLLSGTNSGGKSSVIQAIVLLAQTLAEREWGRSLLLDGPELALGSVADVLNQRSSRRQLGLGASVDGEKVIWTFKTEDRRALSVDVESVLQNGIELPLKEALRWLLPMPQAEHSAVVQVLRGASWISAERTGPRELAPLRDADSHARVGSRGELAAGLVYWRESDVVAPEVCIEGTPPTLYHQVRAQMRAFFPGCDLRVTPVDGASAVSLRLRADSRSDFHRPQNVGFGLTQLFPILVALVAARRGDLLLIENPEVHLHPRAQQNIGTVIARTVASGVQVILETHSDHVLNGIRLAVKQGKIPHRDVMVHFFAPSKSEASRVLSPTIDANGRLSAWPEGFFDQMDSALSELL